VGRPSLLLPNNEAYVVYALNLFLLCYTRPVLALASRSFPIAAHGPTSQLLFVCPRPPHQPTSALSPIAPYLESLLGLLCRRLLRALSLDCAASDCEASRISATCNDVGDVGRVTCELSHMLKCGLNI
jgi:hypothetical protein